MFNFWFWLFEIFFLILWLKGKKGYEKLERQFEEDNFRSELAERKTIQRGKKGKRKTF